jgi:hypothetical protein
MQELQGLAEQAVAGLPDGEIVQFERVGFVRLERQEKELVGVFAHK